MLVIAAAVLINGNPGCGGIQDKNDDMAMIYAIDDEVHDGEVCEKTTVTMWGMILF